MARTRRTEGEIIPTTENTTMTVPPDGTQTSEAPAITLPPPEVQLPPAQGLRAPNEATNTPNIGEPVNRSDPITQVTRNPLVTTIPNPRNIVYHDDRNIQPGLGPSQMQYPPNVREREPQQSYEREERVHDPMGPYTTDEEDSEEIDVNPRRRRPSKEPMRGQYMQSRETLEEKIASYETEIAELKRILQRQESRANVIELDATPRERRLELLRADRRLELPRADPYELLPLGDPDDPTPPFTETIMTAHISRKFKMPTIKTYDGTSDPANHVRTFSNALLLQPVTDAIKCRAFPQTLGGMAQRWYSRLPPNSIGSFRELSRAFISQFISGKIHEKSSASLMSLEQGRNESLRDYINRFTKEALKVPDLDEKVAMIALQHGTTDLYFKRSLAKHPPENMLMLQDRAGKYIKAEESMKRTVIPTTTAGNNKRKESYETDRDSENPSKRNPLGPKFSDYARLNTPRSQILMEIEEDRDLRWPKPLKSDPEKRNKNVFCQFHNDIGHNTDDCRQLKDEIEFLIRKGKLSQFIKDENRDKHDNTDRNP